MIFVHVASYRDRECEPTVRDLFEKARWPEKINVGIALQHAAGDDLVFHHERVRFLVQDHRASRGCCAARSLAYRLYDGEDHILQIDSHSRFAEGWDEKFLAELEETQSSRSVLTTYCNPYDPPDDRQGSESPILAAKAFETNGFLSVQGLLTGERRARPKKTAFVSAHCLFAPAAWITDVPYDPNLYFFGEETTLAVRLWTSGWDLFCPGEALVWHRFDRAGRGLHWEDNPGWASLRELSDQRMRHLLGMEEASPAALIDIERYGLGRVRSLADYQDFAGIDFRTRTIAPHASRGEFGP